MGKRNPIFIVEGLHAKRLKKGWRGTVKKKCWVAVEEVEEGRATL